MNGKVFMKSPSVPDDELNFMKVYNREKDDDIS